MWVLSVFRDDNDTLVEERALPDCDASAIRQLLGQPGTEPLVGEYPVGEQHGEWLAARLGTEPGFEQFAYFVGEVRDS